MNLIEKINKFNKREKILIFTIAGLVIFWFIYAIVAEPLYSVMIQLNKNIENAKTELAKSVKILKKRETLAKEYNINLERFISKNTEDEEMADLLNEIEIVARKNYIKIINMKPRPVNVKKNYRYFYVDIDIESTMQNILSFIKALKDSRLAILAEQIVLNSRTNDPSILIGKMSILRLGVLPEK